MNSENIRHVHILQYVNMKNNEMFYENTIFLPLDPLCLHWIILCSTNPPGPSSYSAADNRENQWSLHGNPIRLVISEIFTTRLKVDNAYESSTVEQ